MFKGKINISSAFDMPIDRLHELYRIGFLREQAKAEYEQEQKLKEEKEAKLKNGNRRGPGPRPIPSDQIPSNIDMDDIEELLEEGI